MNQQQQSYPKYRYVTYECKCEKKYVPIKEERVQLEVWFCFVCMAQLSQGFV